MVIYQAFSILIELILTYCTSRVRTFYFIKLFKTRSNSLFFDVNIPYQKKIGETEYGWLPLGGYVKISGMIDEHGQRTDGFAAATIISI
jgi:regulator of sigma E protease